MASGSYLICFTGVDGSGKTTHARSLMAYLNENGYRCRFFWGGYRLILSYAFFGITRLFGYWKDVRKDAYTNPLEFAPERMAKRLGILLRMLIFVDFQIRTSLRIRLPMLLGRTVICDRYFYDALMEMELSKLCSERFAMILSHTLPKPVLTFLLDAPETLIGQRRDFARTELLAKRRVFLEIGRVFGFVVIDSSKDFSRNQEKIRTLILSKIGQPV